MARPPLYCVFRIVNEARKEIYLAATTRTIFDAIRAIQRRRPEALHDWDLSDAAKLESLEFNLSKAAALAYIEARVEKGARRGYRYVVDVRE